MTSIYAVESYIRALNEERRERFVAGEMEEAENLREIGMSPNELSKYQDRIEGIALRLSGVLSRRPKLLEKSKRLFR